MDKVKIAVIGGGITGRLVQFLIPEATIYDWTQPRGIVPLTRNYGANYLWRPLAGIPCREFQVITHIDGKSPTFSAAMEYKKKIGKTGDLDNWARQFQREMTGYDFTSLPESRIQYDHRIVSIDRREHRLNFAKQTPVEYEMLISTIPLYSLLSLLGMDEPHGKLQFKPIFFKVTARPPDAPFPVDVLYVNYLTNAEIRPYRYCDRFGERHFESIVPFDGPSTKRIAPGKIYPNPYKQETLSILEGFDIYTFGRYGSWEPDELVHETFDRIAEWKAAWEDIQEVE